VLRPSSDVRCWGVNRPKSAAPEGRLLTPSAHCNGWEAGNWLALFASDPHFFIHREKLVALAARHTVPAIYSDREQAEAGGLISYGASRSDSYRQAGTYVGQILGGASAGSLPVVLPTKYELVINIKTAKELGLSVPNLMQLLADSLVE
jgi:putative tryptophan/tyrosine transport system substrate-binding protein